MRYFPRETDNCELSAILLGFALGLVFPAALPCQTDEEAMRTVQHLHEPLVLTSPGMQHRFHRPSAALGDLRECGRSSLRATFQVRRRFATREFANHLSFQQHPGKILPTPLFSSTSLDSSKCRCLGPLFSYTSLVSSIVFLAPPQNLWVNFGGCSG